MPDLTGKICLVTGASRGIGRGIAIQLVGCEATCYITGRSKEKLQLVVEETKTRGYTGKCIAVECDHANDESVEKLFQQISNEQNGKLDLLVNNAFAAIKFIMRQNEVPFWDQQLPESWDVMNNAALRGSYICAVYASRMMVPKRSGLIVNISSFGGKAYFQMPQYGVGKAGVDRMAKDCAIELEKYNVAFISLWPGPAKTELVAESLKEAEEAGISNASIRTFKWMYDRGETIEYSGLCIAHLLKDPKIMKKTGQVHITSDLAAEYKFQDVEGNQPLSQRSLRLIATGAGSPRLASYFPKWLKLPASTYHSQLASAKFNPPFKRESKYEDKQKTKSEE